MDNMNAHGLKSLAAAMIGVVLIGATAVGQSKVATTAAQFLGISVGPRAIAMGSAYVASPGDVTSLYWNPGAIAQMAHSEVAFANTNWLVGTKFRWAGMVLNFGDENAVGLSMTQLDYGDEEVTTVTDPEGTGETWSAKDMAIGVTYARKLTDRFSIGGTAKYITQRIYNESASTFAFDAGLLFVTDFNGLRIGMSMCNFGGEMAMDGDDLLYTVDIDESNAGGNTTLVAKLKTDSWALPLLFRVGFAMDPVKSDLFRATIAADALRPNDNDISANFGTEFAYDEMVFFRCGYKTLFGQEPVFEKSNQQEGLSLGAGFKYQVEGFATLQADYAWSKFGVFGNLSTVALSVGF